ncbi:MAG: LysE family translocator [Pseudomonas sp.]|uniref:LysE family translocator n=1 Tax=unclassified Pseudomonas TaxID=196821 RepID=UPI001CFBD4A8|nr:LysE family translocator [Pseudomonas sp. L5B5]UCZ85902.1 LysE family translocator [Pseudomonas sp. L5B5]
MLPSLPSLLPFVLFAIVASITPGPTNLLVLSNSARYGLRAALPIIFGAGAAAAGMVWLVGGGLGDKLVHLPGVQLAMQVVGLLWLSGLAWQIWHAPTQTAHAAAQRRLGFLGAAALQLVNPKTWLMALAVVSVFAGPADDRQDRVLCLSLVFLLIALPCLGAWALLGAGSARWLGSPRAMQHFNRGMALLLLAATWLSLWT